MGRFRLRKNELDSCTGIAQAVGMVTTLYGHGAVVQVTEILCIVRCSLEQVAVAHLLNALETGKGPGFDDIERQAGQDLGIVVSIFQRTGDRFDFGVFAWVEIVGCDLVNPAGSGSVIDHPFTITEVGVGDGNVLHADQAALIASAMLPPWRFHRGDHHRFDAENALFFQNEIGYVW